MISDLGVEVEALEGVDDRGELGNVVVENLDEAVAVARRLHQCLVVRVVQALKSFFFSEILEIKLICTISVRKVISRSRLDRWEKWRSFSNMVDTWNMCRHANPAATNFEN